MLVHSSAEPPLPSSSSSSSSLSFLNLRHVCVHLSQTVGSRFDNGRFHRHALPFTTRRWEYDASLATPPSGIFLLLPAPGSTRTKEKAKPCLRPLGGHDAPRHLEPDSTDWLLTHLVLRAASLKPKTRELCYTDRKWRPAELDGNVWRLELRPQTRGYHLVTSAHTKNESSVVSRSAYHFTVTRNSTSRRSKQTNKPTLDRKI